MSTCIKLQKSHPGALLRAAYSRPSSYVQRAVRAFHCRKPHYEAMHPMAGRDLAYGCAGSERVQRQPSGHVRAAYRGVHQAAAIFFPGSDYGWFRDPLLHPPWRPAVRARLRLHPGSPPSPPPHPPHTHHTRTHARREPLAHTITVADVDTKITCCWQGCGVWLNCYSLLVQYTSSDTLLACIILSITGAIVPETTLVVRPCFRSPLLPDKPCLSRYQRLT